MIPNTSKLFINVFGKPGCAKCAVLNQRIDKLLTEDKYSCFEKRYNNLLTEDGLVKFCLAQCLNPNRVPAMVISVVDSNGNETYMDNPNPDSKDSVCGNSKLYQYLGIQTDYSDAGKGIIKPDMIVAILEQAKKISGLC